MIIVTCVLTGTKYTEEDVYRLRDNVYEHLSLPHRFICLSDRDIRQCETVLIEEPFCSPWDKMFLFQPGMLPEGPKLYFDLDVIIEKNIDNLVRNKLTAVRCYWKTPHNDPLSTNPYFRHDTDLNTSVMSWTEDNSVIWGMFDFDPDFNIIEFGGTDRFMFYYFGFDAYEKGLIYSRAHGIDKGIEPNDNVEGMCAFKDSNASVCLYNGKGKDIMRVDLRKTFPISTCQE